MSMIQQADIEARIISIRGEKLLIDSDVAEIYGVETKRVNEAVKNNLDKFPDDYLIELTPAEKQELVENFDRFERLKHSSAPPKAFTEKGLYMLATILKTDITSADQPKSRTTTGLEGNFGFHADGYIVTCSNSSICSCSVVGMLF